MYLCSALDTSAATTILSALATRRGSQVVRSRSAKPLFAGSIPAPASIFRSVSLDNEVFFLRAGSIDSLAPASSPSGLRLCRSAPAGSIPAPASFHRYHDTKSARKVAQKTYTFVEKKRQSGVSLVSVFFLRATKPHCDVPPRKDHCGGDLIFDTLPFVWPRS